MAQLSTRDGYVVKESGTSRISTREGVVIREGGGSPSAVPTLSNPTAINITASSFQPRVSYAF